MDGALRRITPVMAVLFLLFPRLSFPQEEEVNIDALKKTAPKVFIDCSMCDIDYIRTEITFVNYVRDRKEAQIHILVTGLNTGGGGREYTIAYIGQNEFEGINDTQKYFSKQTDTTDEIREGLTKTLKLGLMSYVAKTPISQRISISYQEEESPEEIVDKWKSWLFNISTSCSFNGEKSYQSRSLQGSFSANHVTEGHKFQMSFSIYNNRQDFTYEDNTIESIQDTLDFNGLFVKSLSDHWSVGAYLRASSSTFENIRLDFSPAPAIEYNVFPYSESTRRQFRFLYRLGFHTVKYREETIYEKTKENLWAQTLSATLDLKEKWGSVSTTLSGSHYFHDFDKNRVALFTILNLRLVKGLSFFAFGGGSRIHDQLALIKGDATLEEVLLRRRQLESSYDYFISVGLNFTFGSIYTNVVNPRFGSSGYGGMSITIN